MPQMAPMSWFILFIIFCLTLMIFNFMNYFIFNYKSISNPPQKSEVLSISLNWKW